MLRWLTVLALVVLVRPVLAQPQAPNIVVILADDLGYGDVGCYNDESRIPTPHIDALAAAGMRFTDAHTPSSVCTPTRYGLLTGRFCWRTPLKRSVLWPWDPPLIEADRLTLPAMLRAQGYTTACIGKWHLGWDWPLEGGGYGVRRVLDGHTMAATKERVGVRPAASTGTRAGSRGGPLATRGFDLVLRRRRPELPAAHCFLANDKTVLTRPDRAERPDGMFGHDGADGPRGGTCRSG